nr:ABC transporter G family member 20-like isoform X1 [Dermatophagoides pteronyssinus]
MAAIKTDSISFGFQKNNIQALNNVSINVPNGKIYSLLGPSGCGKTTLLRIIIGCLRPNSGTVQVLGHCQPGSQLNHQIGYMPQELGLNPFLPIRETFYYYARVNHVKSMEYIQKRMENYLDILGLKDCERRVSQLSMGQKRLLSLGVSLIGKPRLLLLDEPTVGIDSMIRQQIWNHLRHLCRTEGTSVLITTHYIDEAKESDIVSFLRDGRLLAEGSPNSLMKKIQCQTLEEVFFRLCIAETIQNDDDDDQQKFSENKQEQALDKIQDDNVDQENSIYPCSKQLINWDHLYALFCRDYFFFTHNFHFFLFYLLLPMASLFLVKLLLNGGIQSIPVAIHNAEHHQQQNDGYHLSELFIEQFNTSAVAITIFKNESEAENSIKLGQNLMVISFRVNFSRSFVDRYIKHNFGNNNSRDSSSIHLYFDHTDIPSILIINNHLLISLQKTIEKYCSIHGLNSMLFSVPIQEKEIIYGSHDITKTSSLNFIFPSILIQTLFMINLAKSSFELMYLGDYGCMNRDLIQGVRPFELMFEFILASCGSLFVQICLMMIFIFNVLKFPLANDFLNPFWIITSTSIQGMATGILLAILISNKVTVMFFSCGLIITMGFTSGAFWPIETWSSFWQQFAIFHPWTMPLKSLSSAMFRGHYYQNHDILNGQLVSLIHCLILILATIIIFHYKNRRFQ